MENRSRVVNPAVSAWPCWDSESPAHLAHIWSIKMSTGAPPSLQYLAMQSLLSDQALAISALEDLPLLLFPSLFMEVYCGGHTEVLKALVQAWPLPCLPLGDLAESPDLQTFKAVLDGLNLLLAKKERPSRWKLQVLNLRKEHPNIWIQGYPSMARLSFLDVLTDKPRESHCSGMTEEQPLMIAMDLTIRGYAENDLQAHLLQWASERKEQVHLCSRQLQILTSSISEIQKALRMVRLDSIQELVVSEFWLQRSLRMFTPYLGQMKNLRSLTCSSMCGDFFTHSQYSWVVGEQLGQLQHLQELHVHDVFILNVNVPAILRSLRPLKALSLSACALQEADLRFLFQCPCTRQLQHLRLRTLLMRNAELLRALLWQVAGTLETLALEECYITDAQLSAILPTLSQCSQLRFFSFYGNHISLAALQNLLSHTAKMGHLRRGLYPAPLESYSPEVGFERNFDPERFAEVGAALVQTLRDVGTNQKVQICTNFCHRQNRCQIYSLTLDGSWAVTKEGLPGFPALPM
ncbi:PRAME family member 8-like [Dipodomys spectabilis]|uniref:PRAME family member 8-like n=1 Tax=Dipodomys spectabilis TaxID=105255 RepID=UPI001C53ED97|nr:PRAME family member 8-like [Dipodomys spectabilis]